MKTQVAAIEFGTSKIVTVIAQSSDRNSHCDIISCGKVDYAGYGSGDWNDWEHLSDAVYNSIIAAQSESKSYIKEIYIGVPCEFIHVKTTEANVSINNENGRVTAADVHAVEDMAARLFNFKENADMVIHRSPAWYSVNNGRRTMEPIGMRGERLSARISFITVAAEFVDDMRTIMGRAGITINGFLSPSLGEQLSTTKEADRDQRCMYVDCGMYNTEVSVLNGDAMTYHAVLPCGGNDITARLADEFNIRYDTAEQLKRSVCLGENEDTLLNPPVCYDNNGRRVRFDAEEVCQVVRSALDDVCLMIKRTDEDAEEELVPRSKVYLTGGGLALLRGGTEYLEKYLGRKVEEAITVSKKLGSPEYTSVLGLVDLIFDSIEQRFGEQETLPVRVFDTLKGLFDRSRDDEEE